MESENLLNTTGEPHLGKSTLGEELLFEMYLNGYNVGKFDAEGTPMSKIIEQIELTDKGIFLFDDPFGSLELTNPTFADRLYDLLRISGSRNLIVIVRKKVLKEVLYKTKISETIP